ncbi:MlaA family lipoprotein [Candidatus Spongiihabitans sp.]|uniref:MlaA family lipoprotein n=1 Tax=Candidatus Spongiihabitans sp. TaxID=3101308 RepID=UPI003C6F3B8F
MNRHSALCHNFRATLPESNARQKFKNSHILMLNKPAIIHKYSGVRLKNFNNGSNKWPNKGPNNGIAAILLVFSLSLITGCATTSSAPGTKDSFEKANRAILDFNLASDRLVLKPIAKAYVRVVPDPVRKGVNNFFSNLWQPMTVANDVLQGKLGYAARDTSRFLINTTAGILGIFDVASELGLPRHREDFGQTLAVWGVPSGPYLVLPFLGPSNLRDAAGLIPQFVYADAVEHIDSPEIYYAKTLRIVDARMQLLGADDILDLQPDKYLFIRENYRQQRLDLIHDGNPPAAQAEDSDDPLIDQLLQDD